MKLGKVIGFGSKKNYTNKRTNETYPVITVYVATQDPAVVGVKAEEAWLRCNPDESQYNSYSWITEGAECIVVNGGYQGSISDLIPVGGNALNDILSALTKA